MTLTPWQAYGILFTAVQGAYVWKRPALVEALKAEVASNPNLTRCRYSERSLRSWTSTDRNPRKSRNPSDDSAAHLHDFLTRKLSEKGLAEKYREQLDAITPSATEGDPTSIKPRSGSQESPSDEQWIARVAEETCLADRYQAWAPTTKQSTDIAAFLGRRYRATDKLISVAGRTFPVAVLWSTKRLNDPDSILELELERDEQTYTISKDERLFLRLRDERRVASGRTSYNGEDYRMVAITIKGKTAKIRAGLGSYHEHQLSQMSLLGEINKTIQNNTKITAQSILSRRECFEEVNAHDSLYRATRRCAAIVTVTLLAIKYGPRTYKCLIPQRSENVAQFPGRWDAPPSGMFERCCISDDPSSEWSIRNNVIREFAEEVAGQKSETEPKTLLNAERHEGAVALLTEKIEQKSVLVSATGIAVDLTTLVPVITVILLFKHESDLAMFKGELNWEFRKRDAFHIIHNYDIERFVQSGHENIVPNGLVALKLGMEWLKANPAICG